MKHSKSEVRHKTNIKYVIVLCRKKIWRVSQSKSFFVEGQIATPDLSFSIPKERRETDVGLRCPQVSSR